MIPYQDGTKQNKNLLIWSGWSTCISKRIKGILRDRIIWIYINLIKLTEKQASKPSLDSRAVVLKRWSPDHPQQHHLNLLENQILGSYQKPTKSESLRVESTTLCFNMAWGFLMISVFESVCCGGDFCYLLVSTCAYHLHTVTSLGLALDFFTSHAPLLLKRKNYNNKPKSQICLKGQLPQVYPNKFNTWSA